ncbi:bcl-2-related ovarian killer protein homolog A isoform X2 [Anarhichas minor]|uniref:bcl-2-related ovarian killer protein homolog A isoform X2 n=1 Tax=Anarhichas minor TaxID=65739 RepID=UPI003F73DC83
MEMLRRSSVFAAEVFDRSPTDKELVSQAKALCRDYIYSRLNRAGIGWSKPDHGRAASGGALGDISSVLLWLGDELEYLRPNVYRNVARQLNITVASESIVSDAFLAVAADIFSTGGCNEMRGEHRSQLPLSLAGVRRLCLRTLPEGHCVVPPQRHVKDKVTHWFFFCSGLTDTVPRHHHQHSTKASTALDYVYTRLH